ncbi:MAG: hypothetical protein ACJA1U_001148 [Bermanella sp.]|jgi:hypothetical protein
MNTCVFLLLNKKIVRVFTGTMKKVMQYQWFIKIQAEIARTRNLGNTAHARFS